MQKAKLPLNLILLGDPGAGKATQGAILAKKYNMFDYDMGRELTILRDKNKEVNLAQERTADKGILTPTKIVRELNKTKILSLPNSKGILFDGHPKMLGEAKLIAGLLKKQKRSKPLVIYLSIPESEVVKRISKRKGYNETKYNKRADDSLQALKNRARYYKKNIKEVIQFFQSQYDYKKIDGLGTRSEVSKRIAKVVQEYINKQ